MTFALNLHDDVLRKTPFPVDFPRVIVHQSNGSKLRLKCEDYLPAKLGDAAAAARIAKKLLNSAAVAKLGQALGDFTGAPPPILIAPFGESPNLIPLACAEGLATALNWETDGSVVRIGRTPRTGASALQRLFIRSRFRGTIKAGRRYVIVDDVVTQGGTIADLRGFIEQGGGAVVCATTLIAANGSTVLRISPNNLRRLRTFASNIEDFWRSYFGFDFSCFTQAEGRALDYFCRRSSGRLGGVIAAIQKERLARTN